MPPTIQDARNLVSGALVRRATEEALIKLSGYGKVLYILDDALALAQGTPSEGFKNWVDVRENIAGPMAARMREKIGRKPQEKLMDEIDSISDEDISSRIEAENDSILETISEEIILDFRIILLASLLGDKSTELWSSFASRLWSVYQLGGWPCGLRGSLPDGELQIFAINK